MQGFGLGSRDHQVFVPPEVAQAGLDNVLERVRRRHVRLQRNPFRLEHRRDGIDQRIAALGLGHDAERDGHYRIELASEREQRGGVAVFQFQLDFADR